MSPLAFRDFRLFWAAVFTLSLAAQMAAVAIGWQVYEISGRALDLGLIGLFEFLPLPLLALPAGQLADRVSRRLLYATSAAIYIAVLGGLLAITLAEVRATWPYFALAFLTGIAWALGWPASRALSPSLVPGELLPRAMAQYSAAWQIASVAGPALGGLLFVVGPSLTYATAIVLTAVAFGSVLAIRDRGAALVSTATPTLRELLAGVALVRRTPVLLGAISLDLFAVLFGGAVALLPVFAKDILEVGPVGLGALRSAPAVGALIAALVLARRPLAGNVGRILLMAVGAFGVSMVVFGLSRSFALSLAALVFGGGTDMVSVVLRATILPLVTPDELLGRANAVEMVFISASNELGAFESGAAAALVGVVPAVVIGGCATIVIALLWGRVFPSLARVDRLEDLRPARPG
ncbi:MAG: MFS transporter [Thermoleophilia bacterium]|nr:MFS transporter [Thermoleophilia bacterium]